FYLPSEVPFSQSQSYSIHPAGDDDDSKPEPEDNRPRQRVIIDTAILDTTPAEVIDIAHKRALALVDSLLAAEKGKVLREIEEWLEKYASSFSLDEPQSLLYEERRNLVAASIEEGQQQVENVLARLKEMRQKTWAEWERAESAIKDIQDSIQKAQNRTDVLTDEEQATIR
ncbi:MAG: hypothetical protein EZS28_051319, partial [Streblomastix strix]